MNRFLLCLESHTGRETKSFEEEGVLVGEWAWVV